MVGRAGRLSSTTKKRGCATGEVLGLVVPRRVCEMATTLSVEESILRLWRADISRSGFRLVVRLEDGIRIEVPRNPLHNVPFLPVAEIRVVCADDGCRVRVGSRLRASETIAFLAVTSLWLLIILKEWPVTWPFVGILLLYYVLGMALSFLPRARRLERAVRELSRREALVASFSSKARGTARRPGPLSETVRRGHEAALARDRRSKPLMHVRKTPLVGLLGALVACSPVAGYRYMQEGKPHAETIVRSVSQEWNPDELIRVADRRMLDVFPEARIRETVATCATALGPIIRQQTITGSTGYETGVFGLIASYVIELTGEDGTAQVTIKIQKSREKWRVLGFWVRPISTGTRD